MNDGMLTVSNSEFGKLEILMENGKELFTAKECARILGYSDPNGAVRNHCKGCVKRTVVDARGCKQIANYIPEGDLYRLIIRSRLPAAQKFEKWLFDEVLPELRRTGGYRAKPAADLPHQWMGRGCIIVDEAVKRLGVKKDKVVGLLRQRKTSSITVWGAWQRVCSSSMTPAMQSCGGSCWARVRRIPRCRWRRKSRCCPQQCRRRMNSCGLRWRKSGKLQENWGSEGKRRRLTALLL